MGNFFFDFLDPLKQAPAWIILPPPTRSRSLVIVIKMTVLCIYTRYKVGLLVCRKNVNAEEDSEENVSSLRRLHIVERELVY